MSSDKPDRTPRELLELLRGRRTEPGQFFGEYQLREWHVPESEAIALLTAWRGDRERASFDAGFRAGLREGASPVSRATHALEEINKEDQR